MKIITKEELAKQPAGTIFREFRPDVFDTDWMIKTGDALIYNMNDDIIYGWLGGLSLAPYMNEIDNKYYTNWSSFDDCDADYDEDTLFAVFSREEVKQLVRCLEWALSGLESDLNQDIWFGENGEAYTKEEIELIEEDFQNKLKQRGDL